MTQYNTFYVPVEDGGEAQERLNAFLRGHRVLQVSRTEFAGGWGFCVEWMEGAAPSRRGEEDWRKSPRVDYREVLSAEEFGRDECAQCSPPPVGGAEGRGLPFSISGETHCGRPERPRAGGDRCD